MSYSKLDATLERVSQIEEAIFNSDVEQLYAIADSFAEQDDMEQAHYFRKIARSIETAENYHDQLNNN